MKKIILSITFAMFCIAAFAQSDTLPNKSIVDSTGKKVVKQTSKATNKGGGGVRGFDADKGGNGKKGEHVTNASADGGRSTGGRKGGHGVGNGRTNGDNPTEVNKKSGNSAGNGVNQPNY